MPDTTVSVNFLDLPGELVNNIIDAVRAINDIDLLKSLRLTNKLLNALVVPHLFAVINLPHNYTQSRATLKGLSDNRLATHCKELYLPLACVLDDEIPNLKYFDLQWETEETGGVDQEELLAIRKYSHRMKLLWKEWVGELERFIKRPHIMAVITSLHICQGSDGFIANTDATMWLWDDFFDIIVPVALLSGAPHFQIIEHIDCKKDCRQDSDRALIDWILMVVYGQPRRRSLILKYIKKLTIAAQPKGAIHNSTGSEFLQSVLSSATGLEAIELEYCSGLPTLLTNSLRLLRIENGSLYIEQLYQFLQIAPNLQSLHLFNIFMGDVRAPYSNIQRAVKISPGATTLSNIWEELGKLELLYSFKTNPFRNCIWYSNQQQLDRDKEGLKMLVKDLHFRQNSEMTGRKKQQEGIMSLAEVDAIFENMRTKTPYLYEPRE